MSKQLHLFLTFAILLCATITGFAQAPPNDNCADAISIASETIDLAFTTIDANTDGPEHPNDCVGSGSTGEVLWNDVWYLYTPDYTGNS